MRILFDQGTPAPLRLALIGHSVVTAYELGWSTLQNGALLHAAESSFDAFVTTDRNLRYQKNLSTRSLAILVLPTTNWPMIRRHEQTIAAAVGSFHPGDFVELTFGQLGPAQ